MVLKINVSSEKIEKVKCDLLVTGLFEKENPTHLASLDRLISGAIRKAVKEKEFTGKEGQSKLITTLGNLPSKNILLLGLGKKKEFDPEKSRKLFGTISRLARDKKYKTVTTNLNQYECCSCAAEGIILGLYKFERKSEKKKETTPEFTLLEKTTSLKKSKSQIEKAKKICNNVLFVRELVNTPGSELTPSEFAKHAKKIAKGKISIKILSKSELKKKGFNAHLAVGRGSPEDPKLVIMEYKGSSAKPFVLLGKGVTFDAGGINLKPWKAMLGMQQDMAGAATVLGTIKTISELKLPVHVIGLMPLAENMTGGAAYKTGDILKSFGGKTIEVGHTDAEGRLLMADSLGYADTLKPQGIIDLATLTGSCVVALGYSIAAIMGDKKIITKLIKAADSTDEKIWELPLEEEHKEAVKSQIADVRNIGDPNVGAGVITAGAFLSNFTKSPWVHIDIAGTAWSPRDLSYIKTGGTGFGVRLLTKFFENYK
jgi:leucyl aminopeptidase